MSFHRRDVAGQALLDSIMLRKIEQVSFVSGLDAHLFKMGLRPRMGLDQIVCRLSVPIGQEIFHINHLQFFYRQELLTAIRRGAVAPTLTLSPTLSPTPHGDDPASSSHRLQVAPHARLSIASPAGGPAGFRFDTMHTVYKALLGARGWSGTGRDRVVSVLDSGIERGRVFRVVAEKNFVDSSQTIADDDHGHGTAIAAIIQNLCPDVQIVVYKVADACGKANEWDLLAALAAQNRAHVVNMSLAAGAPTSAACESCGRSSRPSRSAVFESLVGQVMGGSDGPLVVAAAGVHPDVFVAPGGQAPPPAGSAGSVANVNRLVAFPPHFGTAYAAAYASGMIAALWSTPPYASLKRDALLAHLRASADRDLPWHDSAWH